MLSSVACIARNLQCRDMLYVSDVLCWREEEVLLLVDELLASDGVLCCWSDVESQERQCSAGQASLLNGQKRRMSLSFRLSYVEQSSLVRRAGAMRQSGPGSPGWQGR